MILHLSHALAKRLRCDLSLKDQKVAQPGRMDSWSADLFQVRSAGSHALVMHDASLWPIVLPLQSGKRYEDFLHALLLHIEASYLAAGGHFDQSNLTVLATKRSNRSIIGSMNEAKYQLRHEVARMLEERGAVDWVAARNDLAETPFFAVEGHFPSRRFAELVAGQT